VRLSRSPIADPTEEDPFDLPLDDELDLEPGDDGDIRDPEAILAWMRASAGARSMRPNLDAGPRRADTLVAWQPRDRGVSRFALAATIWLRPTPQEAPALHVSTAPVS
jgi:hypothetical protein